MSASDLMIDEVAGNNGALVVAEHAIDSVALSRAISEMRQVRNGLREADAVGAVKAALFAEAVASAAKTQRAYELYVEAAETQIRAERKVGEFLDKDPKVLDSFEITPTKRGTFISLAAVPEVHFAAAVKYFLDRGYSCSAGHVIRKARELSLVNVEPGIGRDYEGSYWIKPAGRLRNTHCETLDEARAELRRDTGLKTKWDRSARAQKIDRLHGEARKFAQAISFARSSERGEVRQILEEAELLQAQVAEKLFRAWQVMQTNRPRSEKTQATPWLFSKDSMQEAAQKLHDFMTEVDGAGREASNTESKGEA